MCRRALLALMSVGLFAVAGLELLAVMEAYDSPDKPSWWWVYAPVGAAIWGLIAAGIGGLGSRITVVIYGVAAVIAGALQLSERPWLDWFQSRMSVVGAAAMFAVILAGVAAVVLALRPGRQPDASDVLPS